MSLKVGDKVRVKPEITRPSCGWGLVKHGDVGVIKVVGAFGDLTVDFPEQRHWAGHTNEMELAQKSALIKEVVVSKTKRKSPEKVLAYGIMKGDELHTVVHDRDKARETKLRMGGKKNAITIVVLNAGKEIR